MATRDTMKAAQELQAKWQGQFPNATIRITDNSGVTTVGRGVAEAKGLAIINDTGRIMVKVNMPRFDILEVRKCGCGAEVLTKAIGQITRDECPACKEVRKDDRRRQQLRQQERNDSFSARLEADRLYDDR